MRSFSEVRRDHLRRWANIPRMYQDVKLEDYDQQLGNPAAYEAVMGYVENLDTYLTTGLGLCLIGPPGVAKTWLTCAVLNKVMEMNKPAYFTTLADYVKLHQRLISLEQRSNGGGLFDSIDDFTEYTQVAQTIELVEGAQEDAFSVVAFDDVGKEHKTSSGYAVGLFDTAIRTRYSNGRPTILTSNLPVAKWDKEYSDSMRSYIQEACIIVSVVSDDYRSQIRRNR